MTGIAQLIGRFVILVAVVAGVLVIAPGLMPSTCAVLADVPVPNPPTAFKGDQCVAPVSVIRREHMNFLKHQRDETVQGGIRSGEYSLRQCIECHAVPDQEAGGKRTVRAFCSECHQYAAVSIDCFECHTNQAETASLTGPLPFGHPQKRVKAPVFDRGGGIIEASLVAKLESYVDKGRLDRVRQSQ